jgi:hypothetical protein
MWDKGINYCSPVYKKLHDIEHPVQRPPLQILINQEYVVNGTDLDKT